MRIAGAMVMAVVGTSALAALVMGRPGIAGASTAVQVGGLKVSPKVLPPEGGAISLAVNVADASTCTITVTPAVSGFPLTAPCSSGTHLGKGIILCPTSTVPTCPAPPGTPASTAVSYSFSVSATGSAGTVLDSVPATLTQEAYDWAPTLGSTALTSPQTDVSCAAPKFCVSVGPTGPVRLIGKAAMTIEGSQPLGAFQHVSCATPTMCLAVGAAGTSSYWDGTGWWAQSPIGTGSSGSPPDLASVSCPSASACSVVDADGDAYAVNPSTTGGAATPTGTGLVGAGPKVSCSSATACLLVDSKGGVLVYDGTSWKALPDAGTTIDATALSCAPDGPCTIVGASGSGGTVPSSDFVGAPLVPVTPASMPPGLATISCPTADYCLAADDTGQAYQAVAGAWSAPSAVPGGAPVVGASCGAGSGSAAGVECAAVTTKPYKMIGHITLIR